MVHVLFVADADVKFGAAHSLFQMVSELRKADESLKASVILPKKSSLEDDFSAIGCDVYRIPFRVFYYAISKTWWKMALKYPLFYVRYLVGRWAGLHALQEKMDVSCVDLIHSNSSREDFSEMLAQRFKKPLVCHIREFGDADFQCYSYRRDYIDLVNRSANRCIAISDAVREHWIRKGVLPEKITRIYNGVESGVRRKTAYRSSQEQPARFLMMGAVCEAKGQLQLIEAIGGMSVAERSRIHVDIVGSGGKKYAKEVVRRIRELGIEANVNLLGYRKNFYENIDMYDCGVMCSRSEGFGRVTAEYMMVGLPVIASNAGANPELVRDCETGYLYELYDVKDLAEKMMRIVKEPETAAEMGRRAANVAAREFSSSLNAQRVYQLYQEVLKPDLGGVVCLADLKRIWSVYACRVSGRCLRMNTKPNRCESFFEHSGAFLHRHFAGLIQRICDTRELILDFSQRRSVEIGIPAMR